MYTSLVRICIIFSISLIIYNNFVLSTNNSSDYESLNNDNESDINYNSSDYFDYNEYFSEELEEDNECKPQSIEILEKVKLAFDEGRNITFSKHVNHINETLSRIKNVRKLFNSLFPTDGRAGLELVEFLSEISSELSQECMSSLLTILTALRNREHWAIRFPDSMGSVFPTGFSEGVISSFGEYDECLDIKSSSNEDNGHVIKGQYCLLKLIIPFPSPESYTEGEPVYQSKEFGPRVPKKLQVFNTVKHFIERLNLANGTYFRLGLCIPSDCNALEIEDMLNKMFYPIIRLPIEIGPKCYTKDQKLELNYFQITSISILSFLAILVIISTAIEIYLNKIKNNSDLDKSTKINELLISFSLIKNNRLLTAKNTKFATLDTMRLLLIANVHIGHLYQFKTSIGNKTLKKLFSQVVLDVFESNTYVFVRSPLVIDAFFTISGFLLSFGLLRKLDKTNGRFNYFDFMFQRWIKLTIPMLGSILLFYLFPLFGDGPVWEDGVNWITPGCQEPTVLLEKFLLLDNFSNPQFREKRRRCNAPTWFLSNLLQMTLIAPIFIITRFKKPKLGFYLTIGGIIIGLFASIAPQILFGIKPYLQLWELESQIFSSTQSFKWYHMTTNVYATSFLVGILFGYLMSKKISISRIRVTIYWILSIISILSVYFSHNIFWNLTKSAPLWSSLLWHSIGKLFFSIGFAWICYACCTGRGGYFNQIMSWHGFQPFARLSYAMYLVHYLIVIHRIFTVRDVHVMEDKLMLENFTIDFMKVTIVSYFFYLLIESPFSNIFGAISIPKRNDDKKIG